MPYAGSASFLSQTFLICRFTKITSAFYLVKQSDGFNSLNNRVDYLLFPVILHLCKIFNNVIE